MPTLLRDPRFVLEQYVDPAFIRLARTAEPVRSHEQAVSSLEACRAALGALDPAVLGILLDWRLAPSTPSPLCQQVAALTEAFAGRFARKAVLLLSPEGNNSALACWADSAAVLFQDEEAAIAHVSQPPGH